MWNYNLNNYVLHLLKQEKDMIRFFVRRLYIFFPCHVKKRILHSLSCYQIVHSKSYLTGYLNTNFLDIVYDFFYH